MSQDAFERLLGRLITDENFRRCVSGSCLERMCRQEGYSLTQGELRLAVLLDLSVLDSFASRLDPRLLRAPRVQISPGGGCGGCRGSEQCPLLTKTPQPQRELIARYRK